MAAPLPLELAERQHGLLTRSDLQQAGILRGRIAGLIRRDQLAPVTPSVFRIPGAPTDLRQRILLACLDRRAVASHRTAAWLHGFEGFDRPTEIEVTADHPTGDAASPLARVHRTTWLPETDVVRIDGIPVTSVARTVLALCGLVPGELTYTRVRTTVDRAIRDGLATDPWLWWRLERLRRSGRTGVRVMEQILVARSEGQVTESWLEAHTLSVLRSAGLPLPECQARVHRGGSFVARVDFLFRGTKVVVEVSGHHWHRTREQIQRDAERRRDLVLAGFVVLDFTYDDVVRFPARLVAQVRAALDA
jgi:hypothetical protein